MLQNITAAVTTLRRALSGTGNRLLSKNCPVEYPPWNSNRLSVIGNVQSKHTFFKEQSVLVIRWAFASLIVSSVRDVAIKSILINVLVVSFKVCRSEVNTTLRMDGDSNRHSVHIKNSLEDRQECYFNSPSVIEIIDHIWNGVTTNETQLILVLSDNYTSLSWHVVVLIIVVRLWCWSYGCLAWFPFFSNTYFNVGYLNNRRPDYHEINWKYCWSPEDEPGMFLVNTCIVNTVGLAGLRHVIIMICSVN